MTKMAVKNRSLTNSQQNLPARDKAKREASLPPGFFATPGLLRLTYENLDVQAAVTRIGKTTCLVDELSGSACSLSLRLLGANFVPQFDYLFQMPPFALTHYSAITTRKINGHETVLGQRSPNYQQRFPLC
jgi:hypothetical protein